ncbi:hypothetical protein BH09PLA1_BH09PLA1_05670 [soil metagenome]
MSRNRKFTSSQLVRSAIRAACIEPLETRRLLSTMTVNGTAAADVIDLNVNGGLVSVIVNGGSPQITTDFSTTDIVINGLAGADVININSTGDNTVTINGGTENDTVHIAASSHVLDDIQDLITVNGDAGVDTTIFHDESHTGTTSYNFTAGNKLARTGMSQVTFNTEAVSLATGSGNDTFNVNGALSASFTVDGNGGSNFLDFLSTTGESATISPSGTLSDTGTASYGAKSVTFAGMTRIVTSGLGSLTVVTPNATDAITLSPGSGISQILAGTSGGTTMIPVAFSTANFVTVDVAINDAGGGSDSLTLANGTQSAQVLRVINGTGSNTISVGAGTYDLDLEFGATLGNTTDVTVNGGNVTFHGSQHIRTLNLSNNAIVNLVEAGAVFTAQSLGVTQSTATFNTLLGQSASIQSTFSIAANSTLAKTGSGGFAVGAGCVQSHGANSLLSVQAGSFNMLSDAGSASTRNLNVVADTGVLSFFTTQHVNSLFALQGGVITMQPNGNQVLVTNDILVDFDLAGGKINLTNNDLILDYTGGSRSSFVQSMINGGRNGGLWNGLGITTSAASAAPKNTTLGVMEATEFQSIYGPTAKFAGQTLDATMVLVKYTYYGDADFNGVVNFDDYSRIDAGFNGNRTGWLNGDFDGNGVINFDDYSLIDSAFNTQGPPLRPISKGRPGQKSAAVKNRGDLRA